MKFQSSLILLASLVSAALSATIKDVIGDINLISYQITVLKNDIGNDGIMRFHPDFEKLGVIIDKATSDVASAPKPFSQADGLKIVNIIKAFEPNLVHALTLFVDKKTLHMSLPDSSAILTSIFEQDLIKLRASTSKFKDQLIASAPSDMASAIKDIQTKIDAVFASAVARYR